ncbi:MAG: hypothetical protein A2Z21_06770 [Candidatus Fraserbacteria bacterium RBG_16_55_9]|uniref:DUF5117 domain-containing protein n=1 Tax=Fraserbacteria sp. (strain RBG_16_55_9) TaxID=1817864 RepID=A0A1F5UTU6_FRAXR|nr:MAG: hypothetical protein A2Z21_06770 [Candidatus Fraserbacteria bacterium RBG_16_55_9]
MLNRMSRTVRLAIAGSLFVLLAGMLVTLSGDLAPATAQEAPSLDQAVASMEAIPGYFNTYRTKDGSLFLEVDEEHFGKDFLVTVQMARGIGEGFLLTGYPLDQDMLTFRMRNEKIELVTRNPYFRADPGTPLGRMASLGFSESVRQSFPIVARDKENGRYLIDATGLFISDWPNLRDVLPALYGVGFGLDRSRSAIASVKGFPENVEIQVDLTFASSGPIPSQTLTDEKSLPISYHYSVLALPDQPMKPRLADDRVGYFTWAATYKDFSRQSGPTNTVRLANRWRLEKKDPYAPLSEPVKPIVFYLENTIPQEFRVYIKAGVEAWNKAFEAAGFKNAIVAMDQPNDPNWDPGDARYSTIRWISTVAPIFGAIGPSDADPRSGEILNADILIVADEIAGLTGQYKRMVDSPLEYLDQEAEALRIARLLNPNAAQLLCGYGPGLEPHLALLRYTLMADGVIGQDGQVPTEYVGDALKDLAMHEVGHTLGLRHNFKASMATPNDQLENKEFTAQNGLTASVMEYAPPNISSDRSQQGEYFHSTVGTYDTWVIQWGYMPVGNETLEPHPQLEAIAEEHSEREHLYGTDEDAQLGPYSVDPSISQFDLGSDPVSYYHDLQKLTDRLWTGLEGRVIGKGKELWPLRSAVQTLLYQQFRGYFYYMPVLGGVEVTRAHEADPMGITPFKVLPADEQRQGLDFILEAYTPNALRDFPKELMDKLPPERCLDWACSWQFGIRFTYPFHDIITSARVRLLDMAFWPERLSRIRDNAYRSDEENPFTLDELFQGFTNTIWSDVLNGQPPLDSFQRAIQSAYLDKLIALATTIKPAQAAAATWPSSLTVAPVADEARGLAFAELVRLNEAITRVLGSGNLDAMSQAHLMEAQYRIHKALSTE